MTSNPPPPRRTSTLHALRARHAVRLRANQEEEGELESLADEAIAEAAAASRSGHGPAVGKRPLGMVRRDSETISPVRRSPKKVAPGKENLAPAGQQVKVAQGKKARGRIPLAWTSTHPPPTLPPAKPSPPKPPHRPVSTDTLRSSFSDSTVSSASSFDLKDVSFGIARRVSRISSASVRGLVKPLLKSRVKGRHQVEGDAERRRSSIVGSIRQRLRSSLSRSTTPWSEDDPVAGRSQAAEDDEEWGHEPDATIRIQDDLTLAPASFPSPAPPTPTHPPQRPASSPDLLATRPTSALGYPNGRTRTPSLVLRRPASAPKLSTCGTVLPPQAGDGSSRGVVDGRQRRQEAMKALGLGLPQSFTTTTASVTIDESDDHWDLVTDPVPPPDLHLHLPSSSRIPSVRPKPSFLARASSAFFPTSTAVATSSSASESPSKTLARPTPPLRIVKKVRDGAKAREERKRQETVDALKRRISYPVLNPRQHVSLDGPDRAARSAPPEQAVVVAAADEEQAGGKDKGKEGWKARIGRKASALSLASVLRRSSSVSRPVSTPSPTPTPTPLTSTPTPVQTRPDSFDVSASLARSNDVNTFASSPDLLAHFGNRSTLPSFSSTSDSDPRRPSLDSSSFVSVGERSGTRTPPSPSPWDARKPHHRPESLGRRTMGLASSRVHTLRQKHDALMQDEVVKKLEVSTAATKGSVRAMVSQWELKTKRSGLSQLQTGNGGGSTRMKRVSLVARSFATKSSSHSSSIPFPSSSDATDRHDHPVSRFSSPSSRRTLDLRQATPSPIDRPCSLVLPTSVPPPVAELPEDGCPDRSQDQSSVVFPTFGTSSPPARPSSPSFSFSFSLPDALRHQADTIHSPSRTFDTLPPDLKELLDDDTDEIREVSAEELEEMIVRERMDRSGRADWEDASSAAWAGLEGSSDGSFEGQEEGEDEGEKRRCLELGRPSTGSKMFESGGPWQLGSPSPSIDLVSSEDQELLASPPRLGVTTGDDLATSSTTSLSEPRTEDFVAYPHLSPPLFIHPSSSELGRWEEDDDVAEEATTARLDLLLRQWRVLCHEIETELKRSRYLWPDTLASRSLLAELLIPFSPETVEAALSESKRRYRFSTLRQAATRRKRSPSPVEPSPVRVDPSPPSCAASSFVSPKRFDPVSTGKRSLSRTWTRGSPVPVDDSSSREGGCLVGQGVGDVSSGPMLVRKPTFSRPRRPATRRT